MKMSHIKCRYGTVFNAAEINKETIGVNLAIYQNPSIRRVIESETGDLHAA